MKRMRVFVFFIFLLSLAVLMLACVPERVIIYDITEERFISEKQKLEDMGEDYLIIDVRSNIDYKLGHIKGSINIPTGQLYLRPDELKTITNKTVFLVGDDAEACYLAAKTCTRIGFRKVYNLPALSELTYEQEEISPLLPITFIINARTKPDTLVIDYRTETAYDIGHYPDCILIKYHEDEDNLINKIPWARSYYIYSHNAEHARILGNKLQDLGYSNVHYLNGKTTELDSYLTEKTPFENRKEQQYEYTISNYRHSDWE